jgi:anaerobic magnesium-protoporphyrin IX monomethyl ester cyclase
LTFEGSPVKVALVYPRWQWYEYNGLAEPIGVLHLVSVLRNAGHEPVYMDYSPCASITDLDHLARGCSLVGVAVSAAAKMGRASEVLKHLKSVVPEAHFSVGGAYPSIFPELAVRGTGADSAMVGEAEETVVELADTLERGGDWRALRNMAFPDGDRFAENPRRPVVGNLDTIPYPARDVVDYDWYLANGMSEFGMVTTRGCPFHCTYCKPSTDLIFGGGIRLRSAANVVGEAAELARLRNTRHLRVFFKDDTITMHPTRWFEEFRDLLAREGVHLEWHCNSRVDTVTRDKVRVMRESGCHCISFGVESGSQKILDCYRKGTTPEQAVSAFRWCHEFGVEATANIMIGYPLETSDDIEATYRLLKRIKPDDIIVYLSTAIPGRHIHTWAKEQGYLVSDENPELLDPARNRACEIMNMRLPFMDLSDVVGWKHKIERYRSFRKVTSLNNITRWASELAREPGKAMGKAGRVLRGFRGQGD